MKKIFHTRRSAQYRREIKILTWIAAFISICATFYFYAQGLTLAYGDAESHINISKRIVNSITPGFGQLGGNWLPLHHLLMAPFVINDFLWQTGLGGSIISMTSFIFSAIFLFKLILLISGNKMASWLGAFIFITNPGILYMQSIPMGELPLTFMLLGSVYYLTKWSWGNNFINILFSSIFALLGSLIRYDAYFLILFSAVIIAGVGIRKKFSYQKIEGNITLFLTVAILGVALWIIWNFLIFGDPLYFLTSPYSAKSQQLAWLSRGELPSYHNLWNSLQYYLVALAANAGWVLSTVAILALLLILFRMFRGSQVSHLLLSSFLLLTPFPFYVITLYFGISIILIPQLVPAHFAYKMFNIRYGLMMVPAIALLVALFFSYLKPLGRWLVIFLFIFQVVLFIREGKPIVLVDGLNGLSSRNPGPANQYLAKNYDFGLVMFDDFSRTANPVDLGIPMQRIIYIGNHPYWEESLIHPTRYIRWFIVRQDENDVVWNTLKINEEFKQNYVAVFQSNNSVVYKKI